LNIKNQKQQDLRKYLGMLNFYRKFLSDIAETLAPINEFLQDNVRGKTPILWSSQAQEAFETNLATATLLAHPKINAELALFTDASNQNIEAALQ